MAVQRAVAQTDPAAVLPLGRQHSLLNVVTVVMDKLGHLVHDYLPKVLQILLCVTASVSSLLDQRHQVTRRGRRLGLCVRVRRNQGYRIALELYLKNIVFFVS